MTYTTVYKDYEADTFEAAAGLMLTDHEVFGIKKMDVVAKVGDPVVPVTELETYNKGYSIEHVEWDGSTKTLRAWFR